jgi:hypothetical protein
MSSGGQGPQLREKMRKELEVGPLDILKRYKEINKHVDD